ncbi:cell division suppressor protein YneA [Metabacillus arenae]|uniref:Cell division suppressor protein YneA n=1 Tax=Metabacillus arenae TaxID=2771434 RepID=A0A926NJM9_9BACI|nr:cell division suppressor protein YneA [Metabacillus arenae]MBD1379317.1 cell division suppressor protein YneA [Metabacillus arenae]
MKKDSLYFIATFIGLMMIAVFVLSVTGEQENLDHYVKIEIHEGDTLWDIAETYEENHNLPKQEFVKWVHTKNQLNLAEIKAGDTIVIPVEKSQDQWRNIASEE